MKNFRLLPLLLTLSLPALAESWTTASSRDGDTWQVDTASFKEVAVNGKTYRQVAVKARFKEPVDDFGKRSDALQALMLFDCAGKLSGNREEHGFLGGKPSYNRTIPDDQLDLMDVFPNTAVSDLAALVCRK